MNPTEYFRTDCDEVHKVRKRLQGCTWLCWRESEVWASGKERRTMGLRQKRRRFKTSFERKVIDIEGYKDWWGGLTNLTQLTPHIFRTVLGSCGTTTTIIIIKRVLNEKLRDMPSTYIHTFITVNGDCHLWADVRRTLDLL